jgi:glycosyltransferase involved in cell wall biosynthesis
VKSEKKNQLVSIGMPVYNGEKYIRQAIESILNQDYPNIELIICDNASTDKTAEICLEYQQKDARINFQQNNENLGAAKNFKKVFDLSQAKFFMWAAHDDYFDKSFISKCLDRLNENPQAVLCCSEVNYINEQGTIRNTTNFTEFKNIDTSGMDIPGRIERLLSVIGWVAIYGIIRRPSLERVKLDNPMYGFDVILLLEFLLLGDIIKVPEKLFYYRVFDKNKTPGEYMLDIAPANVGLAPDKPLTFLFKELFKAVIASGLDYETKIKIYNVFAQALERQNTAWLAAIMNENSQEKNTAIYLKNILLNYLMGNDLNFAETELLTNFQPGKYYYNNGLLLLKQEKFKEAVASFVKSIEAGRQLSETYKNLSLCLEKLGDHKTAQLYNNKAEELENMPGSDE